MTEMAAWRETYYGALEFVDEAYRLSHSFADPDALGLQLRRAAALLALTLGDNAAACDPQDQFDRASAYLAECAMALGEIERRANAPETRYRCAAGSLLHLANLLTRLQPLQRRKAEHRGRFYFSTSASS